MSGAEAPVGVAGGDFHQRKRSDHRTVGGFLHETQLGAEFDVAQAVVGGALRGSIEGEGRDDVKLQVGRRAVIELDVGRGPRNPIAIPDLLRGEVELPVLVVDRFGVVRVEGRPCGGAQEPEPRRGAGGRAPDRQTRPPRHCRLRGEGSRWSVLMCAATFINGRWPAVKNVAEAALPTARRERRARAHSRGPTRGGRFPAGVGDASAQGQVPVLSRAVTAHRPEGVSPPRWAPELSVPQLPSVTPLSSAATTYQRSPGGTDDQ